MISIMAKIKLLIGLWAIWLYQDTAIRLPIHQTSTEYGGVESLRWPISKRLCIARHLQCVGFNWQMAWRAHVERGAPFHKLMLLYIMTTAIHIGTVVSRCALFQVEGVYTMLPLCLVSLVKWSGLSSTTTRFADSSTRESRDVNRLYR